jgi:hypothetical protein
VDDVKSPAGDRDGRNRSGTDGWKKRSNRRADRDVKNFTFHWVGVFFKLKTAGGVEEVHPDLVLLAAKAYDCNTVSEIEQKN